MWLLDLIKLYSLCYLPSVLCVWESHPISIVCLQVLRYLLPASGLSEQNDAHASGSNDRWLLGYSHLHLISAHHAGLE